jgi:hypothetical protein
LETAREAAAQFGLQRVIAIFAAIRREVGHAGARIREELDARREGIVDVKQCQIRWQSLLDQRKHCRIV